MRRQTYASTTRSPLGGAFVIAYWPDQPNVCPACTRSHWLVGRSTAECAFCGSALPIARRGEPTQAEQLPQAA